MGDVRNFKTGGRYETQLMMQQKPLEACRPARGAAVALVGFLLCVAACRPAEQTAPVRDEGAERLAVAAASNLQFAFEEIEQAFERTHPGLDVVITYGSSGSLFAQLAHAPRFDIFFSADMAYPERLREEGRAAGGASFCYAEGRLAVWVDDASPLDVELLGLQALVDPSVRKIAVAHPELAPYGRAAVEAMQHVGDSADLQDRLVFGENVSQAAHFAAAGAADVAIVAMALAMAPPMKSSGRYWSVPEDHHAPIRQGGVVLAQSNRLREARELRDFVTGEPGQRILRRFGYSPLADVPAE